MSSHWIGVFAALLTGTSWGAVSPLGRMLALRGVDTGTVIVVRVFLTTLFLFFWILLKNRSLLKIQARDLLWFALYAFLSIGCNVTGFLYSLRYLTVPAGLIIHYTYPLVTLMAGLWIAKEKPVSLQYFAALLVIVGVWLGISPAGESGSMFPFWGVVWGVVGVLGISGQFLVGRILISRRNIPGIQLLFCSHIFGGILMAAAKHFSTGWHDLPLLGSADWGAIALMTLLGSIIAYCSYVYSLRFISAATASHMCTMEIVAGMALTSVINNEIPTLRETGGALLIFLAIFLAAVPGDFVNRLRRRGMVLK